MAKLSNQDKETLNKAFLQHRFLKMLNEHFEATGLGDYMVKSLKVVRKENPNAVVKTAGNKHKASASMPSAVSLNCPPENQVEVCTASGICITVCR